MQGFIRTCRQYDGRKIRQTLCVRQPTRALFEGQPYTVKELSRILHCSDLIVCNLSTSGLTLELARGLPQHLKQLKRLYALDLSSNFITATQWQDVYDLAATFLLNDDLVQFLDLGQNYLPPLQSLVEDLAMFEKFKVFGSRLGLGMDGTPRTGNKGIDYWILNARNFKRSVYGSYTELDGECIDDF